MTPEKIATITTRMKSLYKQSKIDLKQTVQQSYRIIDLHDASKDSLVSLILEAEYGRRTIAEWNAAS